MRCHAPDRSDRTDTLEILLIGLPNVGKSVVFNRLTGLEASVGNYSGTTVEYGRGVGTFGDLEASVVDVPGTYSLSATNEAERVATAMLSMPVDLVVVVADAVNLESSIHLALQVRNLGHRMVMALNRVDVAAARGRSIDAESLSDELGIPVVPTVAVRGTGLTDLRSTIGEALRSSPAAGPAWAQASALDNGDQWALAERITAAAEVPIARSPERAAGEPDEPSFRAAARRRLDSSALVRPWPGLAVAAGVLAVAFAIIVGVGMGLRQMVLLPLLRGYYLPAMTALVTRAMGPGTVRNILIGEYGLLIKGVEWPFALVLPYVISFNLAMSVMEDSGYLPRFAVLLDGALSKIGLRGSHIISLLLGYGCAIPGILSTRAMGTRRERIIMATLISLAIPCISQTGALFALLAEAGVLVVVALFLLSFVVMVVAGLVMDRLLPGERSQLIMELPVLLAPPAAMTLKKLYSRTRRYLVDGAVPMVAAVGIASILYESGLLAHAGRLLSPLVTGWLRLPEEAAVPLLLGIVRRELTVLPLLDMPLTGLQLFVGATVGLFYVPCIAVVATLSRELGVRTGLAVLLLTTATAFLIGGAIANVGAVL